MDNDMPAKSGISVVAAVLLWKFQVSVFTPPDDVQSGRKS